MEALEALPSISRLSKTVTRILGQNPGKFTLQGTNTYLLGEHNPYILVDTGEGKDEYIPHLREALVDNTPEHNPAEPLVSDIILTHRHHDHTHGLPSVLALLRQLWDNQQPPPTAAYKPPRIHKIPLSTTDLRLQTVLTSLVPGSYTPTPTGNPVHNLADSDTLPVTSSADPETSALRILHTPGHTDDSLCIYYPLDRALFTADTVLGHGTTVFEDLGQYMATLRKMIAFSKGPDGSQLYDTVYPGHGPVVANGLAKVMTYLKHRVDREEQIINVLHQQPTNEDGWTTEAIVATIYANYPKELWGPAANSVELHLNKLEREGVVEKVGMDWSLIHAQ